MDPAGATFVKQLDLAYPGRKRLVARDQPEELLHYFVRHVGGAADDTHTRATVTRKAAVHLLVFVPFPLSDGRSGLFDLPGLPARRVITFKDIRERRSAKGHKAQ